MLADAASRLSSNSSVWLTVAAGTALALLVAAVVPRHRLLTALAGTSLAVVAGLTLVPSGGWSALAFEPGALRSVLDNLQPHRSALRGWRDNPDGPANVALYIPAGLSVALLSRRPVATAVGLGALSLAIEAYQATLTTRVGSFDDVVANTLGGALGAAVAAVLLVAAHLVHAQRARRGRARGYGGPVGVGAARRR